MRFQDAAKDARAVVYQGIQADPLVASTAALLAGAPIAHLLLARAVMNGQRTDAEVWRRMFPTLFGEPVDSAGKEKAEAILAASLQVAERGEQARSSYRGAIVEELTARLLARRAAPVRRERRVLFDGVRADIHPYDVTVETPDRPEVYDCKWGARGIGADVLYQLDDARTNAAAEETEIVVSLVVFDFRRSCETRLDRLSAPHARTRLVTLETLRGLADRRP